MRNNAQRRERNESQSRRGAMTQRMEEICQRQLANHERQLSAPRVVASYSLRSSLCDFAPLRLCADFSLLESYVALLLRLDWRAGHVAGVDLLQHFGHGVYGVADWPVGVVAGDEEPQAGGL